LLIVVALFPEGASLTMVDMASQELTESHWKSNELAFASGMWVQQSDSFPSEAGPSSSSCTAINAHELEPEGLGC
jgi:hypothetical protein